jgi:hypothetical protein
MDTYKPDTPAGRAMRRILAWMLNELDQGSHEVVLIKAPDPQHSTHMVRIVQSHNADWYRLLAEQFTNCRGIGHKRMKRPRTFLKKVRIRRALERMIAGDFSGVHAERLVDFIEMYRSNRRTRRRGSRSTPGKKINWLEIGIPF